MAAEPSASQDPALLLLRTLRLGDGEAPERLRAAWARATARHLPALVRMERCAIWLLRRLREIGAEAVADPGLVTWLVDQSRAGTARNLLVDARAMELGRWLSARGVPFVFLKGIARRLLADRYPSLDARVTTDVDLLLREEDAGPVWQALRDDGYREATDPKLTPAGHYHLVPLAARDGISVELHTSTSGAVAPAEAWRRSTEGGSVIAREGLRSLVPSGTEMLWHVVTHAETDGPSAYHLRYFQDAALLLAQAEIDWNVIQARFTSPELDDPGRMAAWLGAAAWLASARTPVMLERRHHPFDLERAIRWRLAILRRAGDRPRVIEKLVDEATRAEAGLGPPGTVAGTPLALRTRRAVACAMARWTYLTWRAAAG